MTATQQTAAAANKLNEKHFEMLRLAKLRGLKVRKLGESTYAVTSYSQSGLEWVVTLDTCACPAKSYCTHLALAVDRYFLDEAPGGDFCLYNCALIDDRTQLRLRIRSGETTRNDRIYLRYCVRFYRDKLARAEAVKAPAITKTTIKEGSRTRTVERVGAFTI